MYNDNNSIHVFIRMNCYFFDILIVLHYQG